MAEGDASNPGALGADQRQPGLLVNDLGSMKSAGTCISESADGNSGTLFMRSGASAAQTPNPAIVAPVIASVADSSKNIMIAIEWLSD